jgi:hypothetical protein
MTETTVSVQITDATSNVLPNRALQEAMYENMKRLGPPSFDEADYALRAVAARGGAHRRGRGRQREAA